MAKEKKAEATVTIGKEVVKVKDITIEHIIAYCQEHNEVAWLKETAAKKVEYKVYPRVKVNGSWTVDKTQAPTIKTNPISFIQIKTEFLEKFQLKPAAEPKKPTMHEIIAAL